MRIQGYDLETTINGLNVRYDDLGSVHAPTIILIHGFPLNKTMWDRQIEALQVDYRVVAYDLRGHGQSESGRQDFSIALFTHDLLCLMETLHIEQATLCGHSMGGYIALHAVENHPRRFNGLILCDTTCRADSQEAKEGRIETMEEILEDGIEDYADACIARYFAPGASGRHALEIQAIRYMIENTTTESLCNTLFALAARHETCSRLLEIGIPTLVLVGEEDAVTPPELSLAIHLKIRGSIMATIARSGHLPNLENTAQFNEHLLHFMHQAIPVAVLAQR